MTGLALVALFMWIGAHAANPFMAVALLSLCFGIMQFAEGAFGAASGYAGGARTATVHGVVSSDGNAPGLLAPIIRLMLDRFGRLPTFASGSVFAIIGAALWLFIDVECRSIRQVR